MTLGAQSNKWQHYTSEYMQEFCYQERNDTLLPQAVETLAVRGLGQLARKIYPQHIIGMKYTLSISLE